MVYRFTVLSLSYGPVKVEGGDLAELGRSYSKAVHMGGFPFVMDNWLVDEGKGEVYSPLYAEKNNLGGLKTLVEVVSE